MSEQVSLLVIDYTNRKAMATAEAEALRESALSACARIGKVNNADENKACVEAQTALANYRKAVKDAESTVLKPLNECRNQVFAVRDKLLEDVEAEGMRLAKLAGDFQERERIKAAAILSQQAAEASELEKRKAAELAKVETVEQADAIQEKYDREIRGTLRPMERTQAKGQTVKQEWQVTVMDIHALYRAHPICCELKPRLSEIKQLLDLGVKVRGVTAEKVTLGRVRTAPERKAIEA